MDKGIFDFKRKMAFVAALVFVSHTLYGAALAETSSAAAAVQASEMGRKQLWEHPGLINRQRVLMLLTGKPRM